jgi:hypothetical protein
LQLLRDEPQNYFYNYNFTQSKISPTNSNQIYSWPSSVIKGAGLTGFNKMQVFPIAKNKIVVRIENIFDTFDCQRVATKDQCIKEEI